MNQHEPLAGRRLYFVGIGGSGLSAYANIARAWGAEVRGWDAQETIFTETLEGIEILTPRGYLVGGEETDELEKLIRDLSAAGNLHLLIDLGETQHINSTALGVLITAHTNYLRRQGQMKLCRVDNRIKNIFVITKLSLVFDVYDDVETAIASFASGPAKS